MHSLALVATAVGSAGLLGGSALPARYAQPARVAASRAPQIRSIAPSPEAPDAAAAAAIAERTAKRDRLNIRIDDEWYDLTNWRAAHPAGAHWIDAYKNEDATEVRALLHRACAVVWHAGCFTHLLDGRRFCAEGWVVMRYRRAVDRSLRACVRRR